MLHKKILWVGDQAALSLAALETLKSLGFDIVYANSGELSVDLVLLDLDAGGIELWQEFSQQHDLPAMPALFLTNRSDPEIALTVRALSGWGCLSSGAGPFEWQSALEMTFALFEARQKLRETEQYVQDATDWNRKEQLELRESEERLQQIAAALRVGIWIREVSTRKVLYVNPAFEEILGLPCQAF